MKTIVIPNHPGEVSVDRVNPGALLRYENHTYIKVDMKKTGQGVSMAVNYRNEDEGEHCILLNPKWGSVRAVRKQELVCVVATKQDPVEVYRIETSAELAPYLRW